jgi:hypothetical protein
MLLRHPKTLPGMITDNDGDMYGEGVADSGRSMRSTAEPSLVPCIVFILGAVTMLAAILFGSFWERLIVAMLFALSLYTTRPRHT